jgi:hypothetical protein
MGQKPSLQQYLNIDRFLTFAITFPRLCNLHNIRNAREPSQMCCKMLTRKRILLHGYLAATVVMFLSRRTFGVYSIGMSCLKRGRAS